MSVLAVLRFRRPHEHVSSGAAVTGIPPWAGGTASSQRRRAPCAAWTSLLAASLPENTCTWTIPGAAGPRSSGSLRATAGDNHDAHDILTGSRPDGAAFQGNERSQVW